MIHDITILAKLSGRNLYHYSNGRDPAFYLDRATRHRCA